MADRKDAKVEEVKQRIDEDFLGDFKQFPSQIKRFFTTNIIGRTFAYLMGTTERKKSILLRCTESGAMKVANVGSGIEYVEVATGTAGAVESGELDAPFTSNKIRFAGIDYDFFFRPSMDGVSFQDQIYIYAGEPTVLDFVCKKYKVQRAGDVDADYRIEFYK